MSKNIEEIWEPLSTFPLGVEVEILTATGLERTARSKRDNGKGRPLINTKNGPERVYCRGTRVFEGSDFSAIAWRKLK